MALIVGVTGGIGCGKTTVCDMFEERGVPVIDTDHLSRQLCGVGGAAMAAIAERFGARALNSDGALNRDFMRALIFRDASAKTQLEQLLHPLILAECRRLLVDYDTCPLVLLAVPLLLQHPEFEALVQRVLVVDCHPQQQIERVVSRSHLSEQDIRLIMAQQLPREVLLAHADDVIDNQGDIDSVRKQVCVLYKSYLETTNRH